MTVAPAFSPELVGSFGLFFGFAIGSSIWTIRCPTSSTADQQLHGRRRGCRASKPRRYSWHWALTSARLGTFGLIANMPRLQPPSSWLAVSLRFFEALQRTRLALSPESLRTVFKIRSAF